jgi:UDP-N-acetylglucosamine 2-epimerase (non-hydrolysing)
MRQPAEHPRCNQGPAWILLTCHRRENHGELGAICAAIRDIVAARTDVIVVCPVHPHPAVAARMREELDGIRGIQLLEPVDYPELLC